MSVKYPLLQCFSFLSFENSHNSKCEMIFKLIKWACLIHFYIFFIFSRLKLDASRYCLTLRMSMTSLLVLWVVCSTRISLTWDAKVFQPYHEHYLSQGTFHGIDVFTEDLHSATGPEMFMEQFYICYDRDGRKTYFKKMDESYFSNRRFWVITAKGSFIASMKTC